MELTLRSFLLFLRKLVSFFRQRWDQSTRRPWYILAFLRSRYSSQKPKKGDRIRRNVESRPANPPTTVICASRLPPGSLSPIASGDTPVVASPTPIVASPTPTIASPTPIPINVRGATILDHEDPPREAQENSSTDHLGVDNYFLEGSGTISRLDSSPGHREKYEHLSSGQGDLTSNSPTILSRPASRPPSRHAGYRPSSQHSYRPPSQYSYRPPSESSYRSASHLSGAESAGRGYIHGPPRSSSPTLSAHPPSIAGSATSQVYYASRPTTRARRPSLGNTSRRRAGSSTPASARQSIHERPPEVPPLSQAEFEPAPNPKGRLRPMVGIDRYETHMKVVIEDVINVHTCPPVTTDFKRWVLRFSAEHHVNLLWLLVILLLNIGVTSRTLRELCTGSIRAMQVLVPARVLRTDKACL